MNGVKTGENVPLKVGDEVCYFMTPAQENRVAFSIIYEDENVTVVDKESGVNAEAVFSALSEQGECYFIHRLDRNTEGLMIFAKNQAAEAELRSCFASRRVHKIYEALVFGVPPKKHAVEEAYLQKDEKRALVQVNNCGRGEKIVTEYEVIEERGEMSLLRITLHTGKTHQIRAHMAYLGYPVVGDEKYGDNAKNGKLHAARQRLIAKELSIESVGALSYLKGKKFVSKKNL